MAFSGLSLFLVLSAPFLVLLMLSALWGFGVLGILASYQLLNLTSEPMSQNEAIIFKKNTLDKATQMQVASPSSWGTVRGTMWSIK